MTVGAGRGEQGGCLGRAAATGEELAKNQKAYDGGCWGGCGGERGDKQTDRSAPCGGAGCSRQRLATRCLQADPRPHPLTRSPTPHPPPHPPALINADSFERSLRLVISFGSLKRQQFVSALDERLAPPLKKARAARGRAGARGQRAPASPALGTGLKRTSHRAPQAAAPSHPVPSIPLCKLLPSPPHPPTKPAPAGRQGGAAHPVRVPLRRRRLQEGHRDRLFCERQGQAGDQDRRQAGAWRADRGGPGGAPAGAGGQDRVQAPPPAWNPPHTIPTQPPSATPPTTPPPQPPTSPPKVGVINDPDLVKALFDIYLGKDPVSADAKKSFGQGLASLLGEARAS
jgi:hypothetical protein